MSNNQTLAVKYRPASWQDLTEQEYIKSILENQIKINSVKNAYLFTRSCWMSARQTSARIFGNKINEGQGNPIEVDAASNNGVDQIRTIIDDAKFKPLDDKYKIYILDECHILSICAWNAMLKLLEEPPKTTIFVLCTTDPQKIPKTILSRVQRYDFNKISLDGTVDRLKNIIFKENEEIKNSNIDDIEDIKNGMIYYDIDALKYIAKCSEGGMRDVISMLDKCLSFTHNLGVEEIVKALDISDYESLNILLTYILCHDSKICIETI